MLPRTTMQPRDHFQMPETPSVRRCYTLPTSTTRFDNYFRYWRGRACGLDYMAPFLQPADTRPAETLPLFVAYALTSDYYDEDVDVFYGELEKFYKEDHSFYKVMVDDFNSKIGQRKSPEELHTVAHDLERDDQGETLFELTMTTRTVRGNSQLQKAPALR
ncbi:unnamed protein product [Heligmosomoides polygyrus]|uniref:EthD domain-containing protein n=1 Tax=Heligmosomoides polygyrus TaxID=6339 RepID=A0A183GFJ8_HELPZ|nr:unnamed protein product [Heligmosomoides polygyrus]